MRQGKNKNRGRHFDLSLSINQTNPFCLSDNKPHFSFHLLLSLFCFSWKVSLFFFSSSMEEKTKNHHSNKHIRNSKSRTPLLHKPPPFHHAHTNPLLFPSSPHHSLNLLSTGIHSSYYYYYCFYSQFHNTLPPLPFHPPPPPLLPLPPPDQRFFNSMSKPLSLSPGESRDNLSLFLATFLHVFCSLVWRVFSKNYVQIIINYYFIFLIGRGFQGYNSLSHTID